MREHCLDAPVPIVNQVARIDPALLRQLAGIGNNINQIARAIHLSQWKDIDQVKALAHLVSIKQEISRLRIEATRDR